jgi:glycosyltransferase involved in cell wall biosynthesis
MNTLNSSPRSFSAGRPTPVPDRSAETPLPVTRDARVAINAAVVGGNPTGLGIYSIKLVRGLDSILNDLVVYSSRPDAFGSIAAPVRPSPVWGRPDYGLRGHFFRVLWLQSGLRARTLAARRRVLLNTVPEGVLALPIPQVTVVHDLIPLMFPPDYPRQQHYFRFFVSRVLRLSRLVVADSEYTRRGVIERFRISPMKVRVIYPGCDSDVFHVDGNHQPEGSSEDLHFLHVGNLLPHKNVLRLLDALAIVRRYHRCRLIIRGEGRASYVAVVRERVERLGLQDAVTFIGYVDAATLRQLYRRATCMVLPSLGEGFGLPVLEAMACGTPVITASTCSLPEVAGQAAVMVDPHDTEQLAGAMVRVLTDKALREELRHKGLVQAAMFSWRRTAEEMSRALDQALAER